VAARRLASRIPAVREAVGLAAYHAGEWQTAIAELRTYHRMTGRRSHLAVLADCERALGRPEKAIDIFRSVDRAEMDPADAIELLVVAAGARRDLGQAEGAVAMLQVRELSVEGPWAARLRYAYADGLLALNRTEEAREWFARALEADEDGQTDAADRLLEIDGVDLAELDDEDSDELDDPDAEGTDLVGDDLDEDDDPLGEQDSLADEDEDEDDEDLDDEDEEDDGELEDLADDDHDAEDFDDDEDDEDEDFDEEDSFDEADDEGHPVDDEDEVDDVEDEEGDFDDRHRDEADDEGHPVDGEDVDDADDADEDELGDGPEDGHAVADDADTPAAGTGPDAVTDSPAVNGPAVNGKAVTGVTVAGDSGKDR
jgi:tetratricopeptide (TPR) repeat protein